MARIYEIFGTDAHAMTVALLERAKATAKPECVDMLKVEDMCMPKPMKAFPSTTATSSTSAAVSSR